MSPTFWSNIDSDPPQVNRYVARTLIRIDAVIWRLRGKNVAWYGGVLCENFGTHGVELRSHFPGDVHRIAAKIQNKYLWTRKVLSI